MMKAFGSFAAPDIEAARQFYTDTLGLKTEWAQDEGGPLWLSGADDQRMLVYPKPDYTPAAFTVLNVEVPDIEGAVKELSSRGVTFERYEGMKMDQHGISRDQGMSAAWLTDPAGNIVCLIQMD
jgi:catechol 2,3-dioxygenase-like lactoylglutathione lyase family enzyme